MSGGLNQTGQQTLAVAATAVGLTLPTGVHARPTHALIYVGLGAVRWRADGTDPTDTAGMIVAAGDYIDWTNPEYNYAGMISTVKFIRDTTTSAELEVAFLS